MVGGFIREEDSLGNCVIGDDGQKIEFVAYDAAGAPHVLSTAAVKRIADSN